MKEISDIWRIIINKRWLDVTRRKKKKRDRKKKFRIGLISIVGLYLILRLLPVFSISEYKTETVENGTIEELISSKAIVLKDEVVYKAEFQGNITYFKQEGEKIGCGVQIAKIDRTENSSLMDELNEIEKQIEILTDSSSNIDINNNDKNKSVNTIDEIISNLQNSILDGDFEEAYSYKNNLLASISKHKQVTGQNNLMSQSLDYLLKKKDEILNSIEESSILNYSSKSGIISYEIDGLEGVFSVDKIAEYDINDYRIIDENRVDLFNKKEVKYGEPIYKIIDNFEWYMMTVVDTLSLDKLEEGKVIHIKINDSDRSAKARIVKLDNNGEKSLVILKLTDYFHEYYNERYIDIHIVKEIFEGLLVPNTAIVEKDGIKGVYIKDISGIVKFRPIKILASDNTHTVVSEGEGLNKQIDIMVNGEEQKSKTIRLYDEVFIDGSKIKEGLIAN